MHFPRHKYYSQTEVLKKYKITATKYQELLSEKNIPIERFKHDMGGYNINTIYVLKEDVESLNLPLRPPKK